MRGMMTPNSRRIWGRLRFAAGRKRAWLPIHGARAVSFHDEADRARKRGANQPNWYSRPLSLVRGGASGGCWACRDVVSARGESGIPRARLRELEAGPRQGSQGAVGSDPVVQG